MSRNFQFPNYRAVYTQAPKYQIQHLKFVLRTLINRPYIRSFEQFVNQSEDYQAFFSRYPQETYPLLHAFADKRFNSKKRLHYMTQDLQNARRLFGKNIFGKMAERENYQLLSELTDNLSIVLNRNDNCADEGWWAVSLRNQESERLYSATFSFIGDSLLIASVQGPAGEEAKDIVRTLTKKMHGLRPQQLLIHALQYLTTALGLNDISGIAHDYQVKLRYRLKKRVKMNYDLFWQQEFHAVKGEDGYWKLPLQVARKDMAEIESKKRSMYRKRYEILDKLQENIGKLFDNQNADCQFTT